MNEKAAFLAGAFVLAVVASLAYYAAQAFNHYIDCRARAVILDVLQGLPISKDVTPPAKSDT